jgi:dTDP-4-dehydrorhamnose 3,5-epimerase
MQHTTKIGVDYQLKLTKQDYSAHPKIDGVKIINLDYCVDDGGAFCEIARILEDSTVKKHFPNFNLRQINWSQIESGLIKAGHLHKKQEDVWFVPPSDKIIVGLIDARPSSPSFKVKTRLILGGGKARLLYIPRGIIHGCANPYTRPMTIIYLVNQYWDGSDEWRVDYKEFGEGFWEIAKG